MHALGARRDRKPRSSCRGSNRPLPLEWCGLFLGRAGRGELLRYLALFTRYKELSVRVTHHLCLETHFLHDPIGALFKTQASYDR